MTVELVKTCPLCGEANRVAVPFDGMLAYLSGALVQDAFPDLSLDDREAAMTGIHPDCWDRQFPPEAEA